MTQPKLLRILLLLGVILAQICIITEDNKVLLTENIDITLTSDIDVFTNSDVGKQINQLRDYGSVKAIIKSFIDARTITISIIESFNSITLNPNEWAIALNNITGLDHLEGQEVSIASDGATIPNQIVVNGSISLDLAGSIVHVGLSYNTAQKNLPLEASALGSIIGTSQHKDKKISGVVIRFYDSVGGKIIVNDKQIDIIERSSLNNMNETVCVWCCFVVLFCAIFVFWCYFLCCVIFFMFMSNTCAIFERIKTIMNETTTCAIF